MRVSAPFGTGLRSLTRRNSASSEVRLFTEPDALADRAVALVFPGDQLAAEVAGGLRGRPWIDAGEPGQLGGGHPDPRVVAVPCVNESCWCLNGSYLQLGESCG